MLDVIHFRLNQGVNIPPNVIRSRLMVVGLIPSLRRWSTILRYQVLVIWESAWVTGHRFETLNFS